MNIAVLSQGLLSGIVVSPSEGAGILGTVAETGLDAFVHHGIPWMGKKAVEMERYYGSEALRDPKLQSKAIDYALDEAKPFIQSVGKQALDNLSTKIRPDKRYKTDRKDLDGSGLGESLKKLALNQIDSGIQENDFVFGNNSINWDGVELKALKKGIRRCTRVIKCHG